MPELTSVVVQTHPAAKHHMASCSVLLPPGGNGRGIRTKRENSWVGIKTVLTEGQMKTKITTITLIKGINEARDTECNFLTTQCPAGS